MKELPNCKACVFFQAIEKVTYGFCRRYPPQRRRTDDCDFPYSGGDDWCGEWASEWRAPVQAQSPSEQVCQ